MKRCILSFAKTSWVSKRDAAGLRGLLETEHVFRRAAEPHDPTGLGLSFSADDLPARWKERLEDHLELLRCYYNFVRPHMALKFGREMRTPAIQAGLTTRRLTLREIFPQALLLWFSEKVKFGQSTVLVVVDETRMPLAA